MVNLHLCKWNNTLHVFSSKLYWQFVLSLDVLVLKYTKVDICFSDYDMFWLLERKNPPTKSLNKPEIRFVHDRENTF